MLPREVNTRPHLVSLEGVTRVSDGDGGWVEAWGPLSPATRRARINPATLRDLERLVANAAVQAVATHVITMDYHPTVTVQSRLKYHGREFQIHALQNLEELNQTHVLVCSEILDTQQGARAIGGSPASVPSPSLADRNA